jgi:hypothetical protein
MLQLFINNEKANLNPEGIERLTDLIELVKVSVESDHIITSLKINGSDLTEDQWSERLESFSSHTLEIKTDTISAYLIAQLGRSPEAVQACYLQFRDARKNFQLGDAVAGNSKLAKATDTLKAFFEWYITLIQLAPKESQDILDLQTNAGDIMSVCNNICNLQLYRSWWALGEILANELEPRLDALEDKCRRMIKNLNSESVGYAERLENA